MDNIELTLDEAIERELEEDVLYVLLNMDWSATVPFVMCDLEGYITNQRLELQRVVTNEDDYDVEGPVFYIKLRDVGTLVQELIKHDESKNELLDDVSLILAG